MLTFITGQNRSVLKFKEEVLNSFNFLIKEYGFQCTCKEEMRVSFETQKVYIGIYHEVASYELIFEIGLKPSTLETVDSKYTLPEIMDLVIGQSNKDNVFFQASTVTGVKKCISEMAELVKKYAHNVLIGDVPTYESLRLIQKQRSDKYIKEMELGHIRPKAEDAWHNKRYEEFVELYESIQNYLSPIDIKKLEYARNHINTL